MDKLSKKSSFGVISIAIAILLKYLPADLPVGPIEFFRGFAMGIGITLLIAGFIEQRKKKE